MKDLENPIDKLKTNYFKELDAQKKRYEKMANEAKEHQDIEEMQKADIRLGIVRMCEALFIKNLKDIGESC